MLRTILFVLALAATATPQEPDAVSPDDVTALYERAVQLSREERFKEAAAAYMKVLSVVPDDPLAAQGLQFVQLRLAERKAADDLAAERKRLPYYEKAFAETFAQRDFDTAAEYAKRILRVDSTRDLTKAVLELLMSNLGEAKRLLQVIRSEGGRTDAIDAFSEDGVRELQAKLAGVSAEQSVIHEADDFLTLLKEIKLALEPASELAKAIEDARNRAEENRRQSTMQEFESYLESGDVSGALSALPGYLKVETVHDYSGPAPVKDSYMNPYQIRVSLSSSIGKTYDITALRLKAVVTMTSKRRGRRWPCEQYVKRAKKKKRDWKVTESPCQGLYILLFPNGRMAIHDFVRNETIALLRSDEAYVASGRSYWSNAILEKEDEFSIVIKRGSARNLLVELRRPDGHITGFELGVRSVRSSVSKYGYYMGPMKDLERDLFTRDWRSKED